LLHGIQAADSILTYAEIHEPAVIVIAANDCPALDRWTHGSVAEGLASRARTTTLVVRNAKPFEAWARGERPLRILCPEDFSTASEAALRWAGVLRHVGPCDITAGFMKRPDAVPERAACIIPGCVDPKASGDLNPVKDRAVHERAISIIGDDSVHIRACSRSGGDLPGQLLQLAAELATDLIVLGKPDTLTENSWSNSLAREILHRAATNVACVPEVACGHRMVPVGTGTDLA
jgi:nucleotide-binding universal stress UspA family protein